MIGILDSGLGGLTTLSALRTLSPEADILFLADQAHAPYGEHTEAELCAYLGQALRFFERQGIDALLLACGTLSAVALPQLKKPPSFPVFEVTSPAVKQAAEVSKRGVAILATSASIRSGVYAQKLREAGVHRIKEKACPLFVPFLEEGFSTDTAVAKAIVRHYLAPLRQTDCDTLLLGCTHYGFLTPIIQAEWQNVTVVDSGQVLADHALSRLSPQKGQGKTVFYTTGNPTNFLNKASARLSAPHLTVYGLSPEGYEK